MEFTVRATWDAEASVWVAESDDVLGLVTEADDLEALLCKLRGLIPELLEANGVLPPGGDDVPFRPTMPRRSSRRLPLMQARWPSWPSSPLC
jgi:predicted RNase H-like HicB family nuclease